MDYKPYCLILSIRKLCPILSSLYCGRSFSKTWYTTDKLKVYNPRENLDKEPRKNSCNIWENLNNNNLSVATKNFKSNNVHVQRQELSWPGKAPPLPLPLSIPLPPFHPLLFSWFLSIEMIGGHYRFYSLLKMFIFKYTREELRESVGWGDLYL